MKFIYAAFLLLLALLIIIACSVERKKDKTAVGKAIVSLMISASVTLVFYSLGLLSDNADSAFMFYSVYYAASDWLLFFMLLYSSRHAKSRYSKIPVAVMLALTAAESVFMFFNVFWGHCFKCVEDADITGTPIFVPQFEGVFHVIHRVYVFAMVFACFMIFIYRMVRTPNIYLERTLKIFISLLVVVLANILQAVFDFKMDPSLAFYSLIAFTVFYFSVLYVPTKLIDSFLTYVAKDMDGSLVCFDIDNNCIFANQKAYTLFRAENNTEKLNAGFKQWMIESPEKNTDDSSWKEHRRIGGKDFFFSVQFKRISDKSGKSIGSFFLLYDETEEMRKIDEERYRMHHDELTGLYNKKYFYEKVEEQLESAQSGEYCMVTTDVRDIKLINDMFGIEKGDEILIEIAETIRRLAKAGTIYGRINADRFAVFMPAWRYTDDLFKKEIDRLSGFLDSNIYQLRIHAGYYLITYTQLPVSVIIDRANMALRSIKYSYTDVIAAYDEKMRSARLNEQKITAEFDQALESGQFRMFLQPQISVSGETLGAEALVRWEHPDRGMIPPGEFISVFERTGLIVKMDKHVWELACRQLKQWKQEGYGQYHISVNISPKDFFFTDIYKTFTELVERYEIDPKNLRLEITETALMNDFDKQLSLIERLRDYGFCVEMDDFGSGYSSLNMLKDINVDTLKIDMGFLQHSEKTTPERSAAIINMIITLSKQLGMEVITEGVETREQVDFLSGAGCDVFQGYYFAKPMRVSDFEEKYFRIAGSA